MSQTSKEPEYLNRYDQRLIARAIEKTVTALTEEKGMAAFNLGQAISALTEAINNFIPIGEFSVQEADLSAEVHTYFRKGENSHLSSILHTFVKEDRGRKVWVAFIKELYANGANKRFGTYFLSHL